MERYTEILNAIDDYIEFTGCVPALHEVLEVIGVTFVATTHHMGSLEKQTLTGVNNPYKCKKNN